MGRKKIAARLTDLCTLAGLPPYAWLTISARTFLDAKRRAS